MDAFRTVCPVFMEFMVAVPGSKKLGIMRTGYSLSVSRLAFVPLGTQDTDPADRGWCVDGNAGWIWHLHQQLFFGKYWKKKQSCFSCLGEDPSGADHRKRSEERRVGKECRLKC